MSDFLERLTVFDKPPVAFGNGVKDEMRLQVSTYGEAVLLGETGFLPHKKQKALCEKAYYIDGKQLTDIIGRVGSFGFLLIQDFPYDIFDVCDAQVLVKEEKELTKALLSTKRGLYQWKIVQNLEFYFNTSEVLGCYSSDDVAFPAIKALKFTVKYLFLPDK